MVNDCDQVLSTPQLPPTHSRSLAAQLSLLVLRSLYHNLVTVLFDLLQRGKTALMQCAQFDYAQVSSLQQPQCELPTEPLAIGL